MRGKRHMFPVPTAMPSPARMSPQRDEKDSSFAIVTGAYHTKCAASASHAECHEHTRGISVG